MSATLPWTLFALGVGHIVYGCVKFRAPLLEAITSGVVGKFSVPEVRRTAFWFVMFGPLLMLAGQVAIYAASIGDVHLIRLVGAYLMGVSVVGIFALPKSPFLAGIAIPCCSLRAMGTSSVWSPRAGPRGPGMSPQERPRDITLLVGKWGGHLTTARGTTPVELTIRGDGSYARVHYTAGRA